MGDDLFDEFLEYDVGMGGGETECPACGAKVPYSILIDEEVKCPKCDKKFRVDEVVDVDEEEDEEENEEDDDDNDNDK